VPVIGTILAQRQKTTGETLSQGIEKTGGDRWTRTTDLSIMSAGVFAHR
jgi:hypothetical protein